VALETLPFWDMTISLDNINMALFARNSPCNILPMIKIPTFDFDIPLRFDVAGGTTPNGTGDTFLFCSGPRSVVMANETVGVVDREV
jgi:hypothetical protein